MIKSVLISLPILFMCCLDVPITIKDQVIKYMRHCPWRKMNSDVQARGNALVSWEQNLSTQRSRRHWCLKSGNSKQTFASKEFAQFL
jgi:hypothetical protein